MSTQDSQSELVHQITGILVKNKTRITPETTYIHDFTELIEAYITTRVKEAVDNYHNEITADETKVWISRSDFEQRLKEAERLAIQEASNKVFVDIDTGHEITRMTSKNAKHDEACSSWDGMLCDCEIINAVIHAVEKSQERIKALTTTTNGRGE